MARKTMDRSAVVAAGSPRADGETSHEASFHFTSAGSRRWNDGTGRSDGRRTCRRPLRPRGQPRHVYGEWRIQIRPDKLAEYSQLIETKGLPLFRAAGGRMVGWWTTLVGDLYEQITIWEYDNMAAFEQAVTETRCGQEVSPSLSRYAIRCWPARNEFLPATDRFRRQARTCLSKPKS